MSKKNSTTRRTFLTQAAGAALATTLPASAQQPATSKPQPAPGAMLFDVHADPMELTNLADSPQHAATRAELSKLVNAYSYPA